MTESSETKPQQALVSGNASPVISSKVIKASRHLLGWSQETLAEQAGVSISTIKRLEAGTAKLSRDATSRINRAFSAAGLEILQYGLRTGEYTRLQLLRTKSPETCAPCMPPE